MRPTSFPLSLLLPLALLTACADSAGDDDGDTDAPFTTAYVVASAVFGPEGTSTYVSVLHDLGAQELDYDKAAEFSGWSDVWAHDGHVYVSDGESPEVTRYTVDDTGALVPGATVSFANYGLVDAAFWNNTFVAPDKAYMINGVAEYVIWNPQTMEITGTLPIPAQAEKDGLLVRAGTTDRANVVRDGKLYQPMYWSDEDYAHFAPTSRVAVFDVATDTLVDVFDAPCPGLDVGTIDDDGTIWLSSWTGSVVAPLMWDEAPNCTVKIPAGTDAPTPAFAYADVTDGRQGAALKHVGGDRLVFSVFHDERVELTEDADPWALVGGENWHLWSYDADAGTATELDTVAWNSGAIYTFMADDQPYLLVPATDYGASTIYTLDDGFGATPLFDTRGWSIRLFKVR